MKGTNLSLEIKFELLGLTSDPQLQTLLFVVFLGMYIITLLGNLVMFLLIQVSATLHTPMYSFLQSLSFLDFCYSSTVVPQTLVNFLVKRKLSPILVAFLRCSSMRVSPPVSAISLLPWPMTMSPFVTLCSTHPSYLLRSVPL